MKRIHIFLLLSIIQVPQLTMALDFSKPSESAAGGAANDVFMQTISKEKLFDMFCEKVTVIKTTAKPADANRKLDNLMHLQVSTGRLSTFDDPMIPPLKGGVYHAAFFNSYGTNLKNSKDCGAAPTRIDHGINSLVRYYAFKRSDDKNKAIEAVASVREIMPNSCGTKVVDYLTYADKRMEQCMK